MKLRYNLDVNASVQLSEHEFNMENDLQIKKINMKVEVEFHKYKEN